MKRLLQPLFAAALLLAPLAPAQDPTVLFNHGDKDYGMYRLPGIVRATSGNLIAYAEGRKNPEMRWSDAMVFFRVSKDGGKTWSDAAELAKKPADAKQNPVLLDKGAAEAGQIGLHNVSAIADKDGGVHWLYCVEFNRCFYLKTDDTGAAASAPVEITTTFDAFRPEVDWKLIATSPGHGIQLKDTGRLVTPVWVSKGEMGIGMQPAAVSTIFSDDGGKTWKRGDIVAHEATLEGTKTGSKMELPGEAAIVQAGDGTVLINVRNKGLQGKRGQATSKDGATGWSEIAYIDALAEPICHASFTRVEGGVVFANPANMIMRKSLTARLSADNGKTWAKSFVIEEGVAGYSDMASDGKTIYAVFEKGANPSDRDPEAVVFKSFGLDALK